MSELKLYNTLTRSKEVFTPIDKDNVRLYACGPTVYDFAHIGNARPVIVFDVLFRLLKHLYPGPGTASDGSRVTYVRNITDVDDKINARALQVYGDDIENGAVSLNEAIGKVTEKTANQFFKDVKALGCLPPTHEPRATKHIKGMVDIIQLLLDGEHAYVAVGTEGREVLFSINSMVNEKGEIEYGKLSGRKLEDQQAGARIAVEAHKRNPGDFVLWKESGAKMPGWKGEFVPDSKAGYQADLVMTEQNRNQLQANSRKITIFGRPGWHIECSAMSNKLLWEEIKGNLSENGLKHPNQFDIHAGGLDLIFPHHENEIAQSCCAFNTKSMASVWMHNGFLQVEGKKMSKSEGNFVTIHELLTGWKGHAWPGQVAKFAMLTSHYTQPLDFTQTVLEQSAIALSDLKTFGEPDDDTDPSEEFIEAMLDDLNTPRAISELHRLLKVAKSTGFAQAIQPGDSTPLMSSIDQKAAKQLHAGLRWLGVDIADYDPNWYEKQLNARLTQATVDAIEAAINQRLAFLAAKNFTEADRIRDELLAQGIQLKDSKDSVTGERVTAWEVKR